MDSKQNQLKTLYEEIHNCHSCVMMETDKKQRNIEAIDLEGDVFIISQALAESNLCKTGVNFFDELGDLGKTGERLDKFLRKFDRTVSPPVTIRLANGIKIQPRHSGLKSVYNTEVCQCYPGRLPGNKSDRKPSSIEIRNCHGKRFVEKEISLLMPRLLLLMGKSSRDMFFKYYLLRKDYPKKLTDHIEQIISDGAIPTYNLFGHSINVMPIIHASPQARGDWNKVMNRKEINELIEIALR